MPEIAAPDFGGDDRRGWCRWRTTSTGPPMGRFAIGILTLIGEDRFLHRSPPAHTLSAYRR
jgi:hypothetical protein